MSPKVDIQPTGLSNLMKLKSRKPAIHTSQTSAQAYFSQIDLDDLDDCLDAISRIPHAAAEEISKTMSAARTMVSRLQMVLPTFPDTDDNTKHRRKFDLSRNGTLLWRAGRPDIDRTRAMREMSRLLGASLLQTRGRIGTLLNDPDYRPPIETPAESIVDTAIDTLIGGLGYLLTWVIGEGEVGLLYTGEPKSRGGNAKRRTEETFTEEERVADWLTRSLYILTAAEDLIADTVKNAERAGPL